MTKQPGEVTPDGVDGPMGQRQEGENALQLKKDIRTLGKLNPEGASYRGGGKIFKETPR